MSPERKDPATLTGRDLAPLLELTERFHDRLNAACGNQVVLRLLSLADAFRRAAVKGRLVDELGAEGNRSALERFHQHRAVFDAIVAGDGDAAEEIMRAHDPAVALERA